MKLLLSGHGYHKTIPNDSEIHVRREIDQPSRWTKFTVHLKLWDEIDHVVRTSASVICW